MSDDEIKRLILARRARFIAAAIAGLAAASAAACDPKPCLSVRAPDQDAGADAEAPPRPCLTETRDPGPEPARDAGPQPCLTK